MLLQAVLAPCSQHLSNHDLGEAAGADGAGMQAEANLLQHVGVACGPAQPHARSQELAEGIQPDHPVVCV